MLRSFTRESKLDDFKCDLDEFGLLIAELGKLFPTQPPRVQISVTLPNEALSFENVEELKNVPTLPATLKNIAWRVWEMSNLHYIEGKSTKFGYVVESVGESAAWCAGANETARDFARRHHRWYYGLRWMSGVSFAFIVIFPMALALGWIPGLSETRNGWGVYLWISTGLATGVFSQLVINLVLSQFILVVRKEEHWWRQYSIELGLILAAIPVIALLGAGVIAIVKFLRGEPPTPAP